MTKKLFFISILFNCSLSVFAMTSFKALNLRSSTQEVVKLEKTFSVVFFSSIDCPCSDSHITHFIELKKKYSQMNFVAINENSSERLSEIKKYYEDKKVNFNIYHDEGFIVADMFEAVKTPHVYVLNKEGHIVYQGGVTNSSNFNNATEFYLKDVLEDVANGKKARRSFARALGCYIPR